MDWSERRERFRALMASNRCVHTGSVYDAISARIAEELGFEVGIFSGSVGSMAVLGAPDLVVLTLTEFASQANRVCRAGNLCLLVDAAARVTVGQAGDRVAQDSDQLLVVAVKLAAERRPAPG